MIKNDYVKKVLSNGIKVYLYKDENLKRFFASYNVKYGTDGYYDTFYYEGKKFKVQPAIAHFLEHMLIETSVNGNMLLRYMDKSYDTNGVTYPDVTSYYFLAIDEEENLYKSLDELITMIESPVFTDENISNVKHAICEELKQSNDNKYRIANSNNRHNLFRNFDPVPVDNNILGSVDSTQAITLDEVKVCYDAYYNDENKFIVIGGNIDIDKIMSVLESIFKKFPLHPNKMSEYNYGDLMPIRAKSEVIKMWGDTDYVLRTYKMINKFDISKNELDLYLYMFFRLKFADSTKFVHDLQKKQIIIDGIGYSVNFFKDIITFSISFNTRDIEKAFSHIENELMTDNIKEKDFELVKREILANEIKKMDFMYKCFMRFPLEIEFTEHMDSTDSYLAANYEDFKKIVGGLDFKVHTTTVVTKK